VRPCSITPTGFGHDLLVMGAYPRPWIELMPGGLTRYVVSHADLPILMRH
jgi:nucleotide-binding universal stress UspA family protein